MSTIITKDDKPGNSKSIKVYSTPVCSICHVLKGYLKEKGISFEDINVAFDRESAMEMVEKSGQTSVPVVEIDGEIIVGFDRERIEELIR